MERASGDVQAMLGVIAFDWLAGWPSSVSVPNFLGWVDMHPAVYDIP